MVCSQVILYKFLRGCECNNDILSIRLLKMCCQILAKYILYHWKDQDSQLVNHCVKWGLIVCNQQLFFRKHVSNSLMVCRTSYGGLRMIAFDFWCRSEVPNLFEPSSYLWTFESGWWALLLNGCHRKQKKPQIVAAGGKVKHNIFLLVLRNNCRREIEKKENQMGERGRENKKESRKGD